MKKLWAAMLGLTATAWTFEGDWSTWDKSQTVEEAKVEDARSYGKPGYDGTPGYGTGDISSYELRALGRGESRWMGSLGGSVPATADQAGSRFEWTRRLGRAEAHHFEGSSRTAPYLASERMAAGEASEARELGCDLVEANREKGRDEARASGAGGQAGGSAEPATTWEMDEKSEIDAAAAAAGKPDC